jgi:3-hydroxybutyryl-CoA dehydratase
MLRAVAGCSPNTRFGLESFVVNDWSASFAELRLGQSFVSRQRTITEADLVDFAALVGDRHPHGGDAQFVMNSRFDERIADSVGILSYAAALAPFHPERVLAIRRISDAVFERPVSAGQTIHLEGTITRLQKGDDETGLVTWGWSVRDNHHTLICHARLDVLWRAGEGQNPPTTVPGRQVAEDMDLVDYPSGVVPW